MNRNWPARHTRFESYSMIKIIIIFTLLVALPSIGFVVYRFYSKTESTFVSPVYKEAQNNDEPDFTGIDPDGDAKLANKTSEKSALSNDKGDGDPSDLSKPFNILVLGIDRRHGDQTSWRTDVIQLITLSADRKRVVVTHVPRDVWAGSYKINAVYNLQGPDAIKDKIQEVTGQRPDRIIRIDFDAFVWAVDGVGGIDVDVPRGFTDTGYPDDRNGSNEVITVAFEQGQQHMDGERALIYSRSRKGTNGEGSDYARGVRQQIVMQAVVKDFFNPGNMFNPKTAKTLYNIATQKVYTDISLSDTEVLFEIMKAYGDVKLTTLSLDTSNYLEVPANRAAYGGAWTLIAKGNDYTPIHKAITAGLTL